MLLGRAMCWKGCEGKGAVPVTLHGEEKFAACRWCFTEYSPEEVEARPDFVSGEELRKKFLEMAMSMGDLPTGMLAVACAHPPGCYGKCLDDDLEDDDE